MAESKTDICNRALSHLGDERIGSYDEATERGNICRFWYDKVREVELCLNLWSFAIKRVVLSKALDEVIEEGVQKTVDLPDPFEEGVIYELPSDYLRGQKPNRNYFLNAYIKFTIEGRFIYTNIGDDLKFRYVRDVKDISLMEPLFKEAFGLSMAWNMCEEITQSNTKQQIIHNKYDLRIKQAKAVSSIISENQKIPDGDWLTGRF